MQSQSRKINRISLGLQNPVASSTKVHKRNTSSMLGMAGFRKNRYSK